MADTRLLGDLTGEGEITVADVEEYKKALKNNYQHPEWKHIEDPDHPGEYINKLIDYENGGLTPDQASVASLHKTGYISNIDRILLESYLKEGVGSLAEWINYLDTKEIIPPPDPEPGWSLEELRVYIVNNVKTLMMYQADIFLELQHTTPSSLHDVQQKIQRTWADGYSYDYDVASVTQANLSTALKEDGSKYPTGDAHLLLPDNVYSTIHDIIYNGLGKSQLDQIISTYCPTSGIVVSDPPTDAQRDAIITQLWEQTGVEKGLTFINEWKGSQPTPSPTPSQYDPRDNDVVGNLTNIADSLTSDSSGLKTFITGSSNSNTFTNMFGDNKPNPQQIVTVRATGVGAGAVINRYEYNTTTHQWSHVGDTDIAGYIGTNGITNPSNMNEGSTSGYTPAGAYMLGNYSAADVGAFGDDTVTNSHGINYVTIINNSMYWLDGTSTNYDDSHMDDDTNWYNTFMDLSSNTNRQLIQYKHSDWDTGINVYTSPSGGTTMNTKDGNAVFRYGQYYMDGFNDVPSGTTKYAEDLHGYTYTGNTPYEHAVVIRFNMPPHVSTPIFAGNAGSGSAFFVHKSTGSGTAGCVAISDQQVVNLIQWLDHSKNPYIFIRLADSNS